MFTPEDMARYERDARLKLTDDSMHLTDHPKWTELLEYRTALRDYPDHADWPSIENMPQQYF
jgi:hypothetical protein|tara:strand:+ start:1741 stop:1926 length:186 start_codon:yes stop_codon:yes gene_type:complete